MGEIKTLLDVKQLSGGYKNFQLQKLSFQLKKGDFMAVIGPNGSGKSTLFRLILNDLRSTAGEIFYKNQLLASMHPQKKARRIAVVNQHITDTSMTVLEYVLLGRIPYRKFFQFFESDEDVEIAEKYLKMTGVIQYKNEPLSSLSGGEQQLTALARALAQEPELLLLDEPTSMLDITHQVQILDLISTLNQELKLTVLMIIHDLNLAGTYCNKLLLLNGGELYAQGVPEDVLTYSTIESVYKTVVVTARNPVTNKTYGVFSSKKPTTQLRKIM